MQAGHADRIFERSSASVSTVLSRRGSEAAIPRRSPSAIGPFLNRKPFRGVDPQSTWSPSIFSTVTVISPLMIMLRPWLEEKFSWTATSIDFGVMRFARPYDRMLCTEGTRTLLDRRDENNRYTNRGQFWKPCFDLRRFLCRSRALTCQPHPPSLRMSVHGRSRSEPQPRIPWPRRRPNHEVIRRDEVPQAVGRQSGEQSRIEEAAAEAAPARASRRAEEEIELDEAESQAIDHIVECDEAREALEMEVNKVVTQAVRKICKRTGLRLPPPRPRTWPWCSSAIDDEAENS